MTFFDDTADRIDGASSCHGKVKYREASAHNAAVKMASKKGESFEAYKCRHCDGWHIGHPRFSQWTEEQKNEVLTVVIVVEAPTDG